MSTKDSLLALLAPYCQQHLLDFWDQLTPSEQSALESQISALDLPLLRDLHARRNDQGDIRQLADRARPPAAFRLSTPANPVINRFTREQAMERGNEAIAAGHLGAMLVAGGQGTRLGFPHPKGMFPIGPISKNTLFQVHIEKLLALKARYGKPVPLYLMTSPATHQETVDFLAAHDRFGLPEEDLHVFCQGTMPAVDAATGKVLLESRDRIAVSPNGHGGMLAAFVESGSLAEAKARGIRQLFYFQVDNPLVEICGPEYVGYHLLSRSEMTTQVIAKRDPLEKVGNVVEVDGRLMVIEYSDLPDDVARRSNSDGSLSIWAGSIAVHVFDLAFLERAAADADSLPFHYAHKKVPNIDPNGKRVEPSATNAIKFERFIFDLMPSAKNAIVVEVDPQTAFAPLKNAAGAATDTLETVHSQMMALHRSWLREAGVIIEDIGPVEISPLYALDAAELATKVQPGTRIESAKYFCS